LPVGEWMGVQQARGKRKGDTREIGPTISRISDAHWLSRAGCGPRDRQRACRDRMPSMFGKLLVRRIDHTECAEGAGRGEK